MNKKKYETQIIKQFNVNGWDNPNYFKNQWKIL